ncbi:sugar isomerase domain-containing protein [uncultured Agrococcus sp.]|uniref:sugar isomerase domain-containing protein n=1 Tax=uncultured Agrococcus sp. TaxID=382258 RepID=UPI0025E0A57C|nr:sugar isomerase domain-containing protein [uncultured Agrococcus sp.]
MTSLGSFVDGVIDHNQDALDAAARAVIETLQADGLVRTAGAGHSLAAVMESFYRAGGLAAVRPLWHPSLFPLADAHGSTRAERSEGLGREVAEAAGIESRDTVFVFSSSGINHYPVELARAAVERGATVVALTSVEASSSSALRSDARLFEIATIVLDTRVPAGDVSWPLDAPVTVPRSSLATNALWSALLARVVDLDPDVELWRSANVEGNDAANAATIARLAERIPELSSE